MTKTLPADVARCHGFCCPQRAQCLRYTDRMGHDYATKFVHRLCEGEGMAHYIPKLGYVLADLIRARDDK